MDLKEILELERKNNEQMLEHKLKTARYENQQASLIFWRFELCTN